MNVFEKIVAVIIIVFALYLAPTLNEATMHDSIIQTTVYQDAANFVDTVCTHGEITQSSYLMLINKLDDTGLLYDVSITVGHTTVVPVYGEDGSVASVKNVEVCSYTDEILESVYQTDGVYTLSKGDAISIVIKNRNMTIAQQLRTMVLHVPDYDSTIVAKAGGVVRDESF